MQAFEAAEDMAARAREQTSRSRWTSRDYTATSQLSNQKRDVDRLTRASPLSLSLEAGRGRPSSPL